MNMDWTPRFLTACRVVSLIGILNFIIFVAIALYLGGDAVNGKVEAGRYYLYGLRTESWRKEYTQLEPTLH
jgi:hypothetical protein